MNKKMKKQYKKIRLIGQGIIFISYVWLAYLYDGKELWNLYWVVMLAMLGMMLTGIAAARLNDKAKYVYYNRHTHALAITEADSQEEAIENLRKDFLNVTEYNVYEIECSPLKPTMIINDNLGRVGI